MLGAIALLALVVRFTYWAQVAGTPLDAWHTWDQTDMATYVEQARRMAAGDWLAREPYHPYHVWQAASGTPEEWLRWYGRHAFHQAPLYSYGLALAMKLSDRPEVWAKLVQLLLGAATAVLLAATAKRLAGPVAGIATGVLAACYGPLVHLECQLLREGPAVFGMALVLWLMVRRADGAAIGGHAALALIGMVLGALAMFHEISAVLLAATLLVVAVQAVMGLDSAGRPDGRSGRLKRAAAAAVMVAAGYLIGFSPLMVRNVVAGASPLAISSRSHLTVALANMADSPTGGVAFSAPGREFGELLNRSGSSMVGVLREVRRSYQGRVGLFFRNWGRRAAAICAGVEIPDNTSYEFHRRQVGVLAVCAGFGTVFVPAVAAVLAILLRAAFGGRAARAGATSARPRSGVPPAPGFDLFSAWRERRPVHVAVMLYAPPLLLAMSLVNVQSRYRLMIVPIALIYAGVFAGLLVRLAAARRPAGIAGLLAAAAVVLFGHRIATAAFERMGSRPADAIMAARMYAQRKNDAAAVDLLQSALRLDPADAGARVELGNAYGRMQRYADALREFRIVQQIEPGHPEVQRVIAYLEGVLSGERSATTAPRSAP